MTPEQKGQAAKAILENPFAIEILEELEQVYIQAWRESNETEAREDAWYSLRGHERFVRQLVIASENADFELAKEEDPQ
jgi:hypothetical protein